MKRGVAPMLRSGPLVAAGVLLGAGLGGFADGILFHQILQWHNMLSARIPPDNLVDAKINMFWDGMFHAAVWLMTVLGVSMLFRAGRRADVAWSGRVLSGGALLGWGLFNLIEGLIDHQLLQLHHVVDSAVDPAPADMAFLAFGALLIAVGLALLRSPVRPPRAHQR
jgi:uncharacterized membrane protein